MEELRRKLDAESYGKLKANKFTDESLHYITDDYLTKIGISEMGPRLIIFSTIKKLLQTPDNNTSLSVSVPSTSGAGSSVSETGPEAGPSTVDAGPSTSKAGSSRVGTSTCTLPVMTSNKMREILENNNKFRRVLYSKLDANIVPSHKELLMMVRILCKSTVERLINHKEYPKFDEKKELAIGIIDTFPILQKTKVAENAPDYSYFFWKNGGKQPGTEHTGLIQSHIRNAYKNILPEDKKFVHQRKPNTIIKVPPEIIEKAQAIGCVDPVPVNFHAIMKDMAETHDLLLMLLRQKKRVQDILSIFPHFKAFNGVVIQKAYERMNPNYNKASHMKQFLSRGLMLEDENFNGVHDDHLRGCLRIFLVLGKRGTSKIIGLDSLPVEEQLAAPLVRWIPKHETSLAEQLSKYVGINLIQKVQPHIITDNDHYYIYLKAKSWIAENRRSRQLMCF
ncbi:uncharacterized protein LOC134207096 [Armigeres subalbatus]|uniref:uncharacterized protein LOC134207096 n=1 Tax=Armigeres subalbatus TaxID=124917 RepID=UPI002ED65156